MDWMLVNYIQHMRWCQVKSSRLFE